MVGDRTHAAIDECLLQMKRSCWRRIFVEGLIVMYNMRKTREICVRLMQQTCALEQDTLLLEDTGGCRTGGGNQHTPARQCKINRQHKTATHMWHSQDGLGSQPECCKWPWWKYLLTWEGNVNPRCKILGCPLLMGILLYVGRLGRLFQGSHYIPRYLQRPHTAFRQTSERHTFGSETA